MGGGTAAVQQPVQVSDYELARLQTIKDNQDVLLAFGLIDMAKQLSIEHEPVKRAKTTSKQGKSSEPGPRRRASRRLAVVREAGNYNSDAEHGEHPDCQATRPKNDEGGEDDEDDEDDEEDEEDEDEEED